MELARRLVTVACAVALASACGGDGTHHAYSDARPAPDAAALDAHSVDAARDASVDAPLDAPACVAGVACATNPGAPCLTGKTACAGAILSCVDDAAAPDGTTCAAGLCTLGGCLPPTAVSTSVDLGQTPLTAGRTCAEAPSYAVAALAATTTTVAVAPVGDCLVAGDEVMLINLQGSNVGVANVGNWELLRVASVAGAAITFTSAPTRHYGATAAMDDGIGVGATDQKVGLFRVPRLGATSVAVGTTLTSTAWDGATGGVLPLRAASLAVDGAIDMGAAGYRAGRWSRDTSCFNNVTTEAGESIGGPALATSTHQAGAAGGIAAAAGPSFNGNTPISPSAGHATAGQAGLNSLGRNLGEPGATYGAADASTLTLGSGASGNLTCGAGSPAGGGLVASVGAAGGGVIVLLGGDVTVSATGTISATAPDAGRDVAASGGYVFIRGGTLSLGDLRVTARGGVAHGGAPTTAGMSNLGGDGYVVVQGSAVTGATQPSATQL